MDLFFVLLALVGIILFWIQLDVNGYLLYSSLIVFTTITLVHQLNNNNLTLKYPKWILIIIVVAIIITGIDRMTFKGLNSSVFLICYILYIFIQPKPAWITRP